MKQQAVYLSPCHGAPIIGQPEAGVWVGQRPTRDTALTRMNPRTKLLEWLDGHDPATADPLRLVTEEPVLIEVNGIRFDVHDGGL